MGTSQNRRRESEDRAGTKETKHKVLSLRRIDGKLGASLQDDVDTGGLPPSSYRIVPLENDVPRFDALSFAT